ncbi:MAG TPA: glycosyltransferase family 39 protein, partial [Tepidisphaeraceae bacterium]
MLYASILLLPFLDNGTVLTRHEILAAEPAREILESDTPWAVQTFAGELRTAKPPTMSWLIAIGMKVTGSRSEFICRLPAALAGILVALGTAWIAARLLGPTAGLIAGLSTPTAYWIQLQARLSQADIPMVAAVTAAMMALTYFVPRRNGTPEETPSIAKLSLWFYAATGMAFLLKFVGIFVTIPAAILYALWTRDTRVWRMLRHPLGLSVFLLFIVIWPTAAYLTYPNIINEWWQQTAGRSIGTLEGEDTNTLLGYLLQMPFYFWITPVLLLPATPAVLIGAWAARRHVKSVTAKYLLAWVVPFFALLTVIDWRHQHYVMSLLPPFMIVGAWGTVVWMRWLKRKHLARPLLIAYFVGVGIAILVLQALVLPRSESHRAF